MVFCSRCWLNHALRILNHVVNFIGMGMIIYSLWLLKIWREVVTEVGTSSFPKPWFIYTCLGVGIVVCFSALLGHMLSNCIGKTALSIYILFVCCILLLQIMAIVVILFKTDWQTVISKYLDGKHVKFEKFLSFHLSVCRLIGITILIVQVNVLILAIVLWALRPEPMSHCHSPAMPEFRYSFLVVGPDSPPTLPTSLVPFIRRFRS